MFGSPRGGKNRISRLRSDPGFEQTAQSAASGCVGQGRQARRDRLAQRDTGQMTELLTNICLDAIVVDESGLGDRAFSLKIKWVPGDLASAIKAVRGSSGSS